MGTRAEDRWPWSKAVGRRQLSIASIPSRMPDEKTALFFVVICQSSLRVTVPGCSGGGMLEACQSGDLGEVAADEKSKQDVCAKK